MWMGVVAQKVKPILGMYASHATVPRIASPLLPIQLPGKVPGMAVDDGTST